MAHSQHTSNSQLDGYLIGIKDEFDRLKHQLEEARKQRDEYMTKYASKDKETQELRQKITFRENHIVCRYCQGEISDAQRVADDASPLISPVSSFSEYYSSFEGEGVAADRSDNTENSNEIGQIEGERNRDDARERDGNKISRESPVDVLSPLSLGSHLSSTNESGHSAWDVEFISDTNTALNLTLVHKLKLQGRIRLAFSMDGKYLATASSVGIVTIFDSKTGKRISVMKDLYHDQKSLPGYRCLAFSPDSKYLATGERNGIVRIWIISQRRVRNIFRHGDYVYSLNFSPNGLWIATASDHRTIKLWRLRDGFSRVLICFQYIPWSIRFSPDGRFIASGCGHPWHMLIWKVRTGELVARWRGHPGVVTGLVFTPDGHSLLSASWDKSVVRWDVSSLASIGKADLSSCSMMKISSLLGHTHYIHTISISPDGNWIASGSLDNTVRIWNAHDAALHRILHCPGKVWSVDFSAVGNYLAIGGELNEITIWNYANL